MKAKYTGEEYANWWGEKVYDVTIRTNFASTLLPARLIIQDPEGDSYTISEDGGKTMEKDWILIIPFRDNLTMDQAYIAMQQGYKVTHKYFSEDEYIYIDNQGRMYTEDGYRFESGWSSRRDSKDKAPHWHDGWSLYLEKEE